MCNIVESRLDIFLCYIEIRLDACDGRNMNCMFKAYFGLYFFLSDQLSMKR